MRLNLFLAACTATALTGCGEPIRQVSPGAESAAYGFFFVDEGGAAKLAYGAAQSDDVGLMLECTKGSRLVEVTDTVRSAPAPRLTLASAGRSTTVTASVQPGEGAPIVIGRIASTAPAFSGFRKSGAIEVSYAGLTYALVARPHERPSVSRFFSACDTRTV